MIAAHFLYHSNLLLFIDIKIQLCQFLSMSGKTHFLKGGHFFVGFRLSEVSMDKS